MRKGTNFKFSLQTVVFALVSFSLTYIYHVQIVFDVPSHNFFDKQLKEQLSKDNTDDTLHPIDEYIEKETIEGSSLHTALELLKDHSLPEEAYGDAIDTEEDIATEKSRCARYGYDYNPIIKKRRRIFMGSLIADDSWHVIAAHAVEAYGLYHTVALVESNTTQMMTKRKK